LQNEIIIAGGLFGEMSLMTGEKTNAAIRAKSDCTVLALRHGDLAGMLAANTALADDLAAVPAEG